MRIEKKGVEFECKHYKSHKVKKLFWSNEWSVGTSLRNKFGQSTLFGQEVWSRLGLNQSKHAVKEQIKFNMEMII